MIHDIAPKKLYNHYDNTAVIGEDDFVVRVKGRELLVKPMGEEVRFPYAKELDLDGKETTYLLSIDDERYFLVEEDVETPVGFEYLGLRQLRPVDFRNKDVLHAAQTCFQLNNWYKDNKFCGTCGHPTVKDERERAMRCPNCGRMIYPRILPACIIGVTHGDEILLIRGKDRDFHSGFRMRQAGQTHTCFQFLWLQTLPLHLNRRRHLVQDPHPALSTGPVSAAVSRYIDFPLLKQVQQGRFVICILDENRAIVHAAVLLLFTFYSKQLTDFYFVVYYTPPRAA